MTYGLKGCASTAPRATPAGAGPDMYDIFKKSLDNALKELIESEGERFDAAERTYNDLWPDGLRVLITREPDGGFLAGFSTGESFRFRDLDELGSALLLMRDRKLFERLCIENNAGPHPEML